jgi:hypothetical protein
MIGDKVHGGGDLVWKIHSRKSSKSFNYDICLSSHVLFIYGFTPLNTIYAELELEKSVSELMTGQEVHARSDLVFGKGSL